MINKLIYFVDVYVVPTLIALIPIFFILMIPLTIIHSCQKTDECSDLELKMRNGSCSSDDCIYEKSRHSRICIDRGIF